MQIRRVSDGEGRARRTGSSRHLDQFEASPFKQLARGTDRMEGYGRLVTHESKSGSEELRTGWRGVDE
jgi:hypothetical protein